MVVWLTGGSSGLGKYTAEAICAAGHQLVVGARSFQAGRLANGAYSLPLDVTKADSVAAFAEQALALAGPPDALVQCAGILCLGPCEETSAEEYLRIMDTDFLGMVRMNGAVLPLMRKAGHGRIVMFSSINGLLGIPFQSAYTAAKHAVEGYAECLQMETAPFGIQVCLVEPGDHRGGSDAYRAHYAAESDDSPYTEEYRKGIAVIHRDEQGGSDPAKLGKKVAAVLSRRRMPGRLRIAKPDQHLAVWLHDLLPPGLNKRILRSYYLK